MNILSASLISSGVILLVAIIITVSLILYFKYRKPNIPEEYDEFVLTNNHNDETHLYYFQKNGDKFYTPAAKAAGKDKKYEGTFTRDEMGIIKIDSEPLLAYIQSKIPIICKKPSEIPIFIPNLEFKDGERYTSEYNLGICGTVKLELILVVESY